jgi:hypothetical protein
MSEDGSESRRFPRIDASQAVLVRRIDDSGVEALAPMKTIAIGGCCLLSDRALGIGSNVELLISLEEGVVSARGRVVYEIPAEDGRLESGIEFSRLDELAAHAIHRLFIRPPA